MNKLLITQNKNINFFQKFFYNKIFLYSKNGHSNKSSNKDEIDKKVFNLSSDFISVREEHNSQNLASKMSEEVINEYFKKIPNFFNDSEKYNFIYWDLRKYVSIEIAKFYRIFNLCQKLEKRHNLKSKEIYLNPESIDFTILNIIKKKTNFSYKVDFLCLWMDIKSILMLLIV